MESWCKEPERTWCPHRCMVETKHPHMVARTFRPARACTRQCRRTRVGASTCRAATPSPWPARSSRSPTASSPTGRRRTAPRTAEPEEIR